MILTCIALLVVIVLIGIAILFLEVRSATKGMPK